MFPFLSGRRFFYFIGYGCFIATFLPGFSGSTFDIKEGIRKNVVRQEAFEDINSLIDFKAHP